MFICIDLYHHLQLQTSLAKPLFSNQWLGNWTPLIQFSDRDSVSGIQFCFTSSAKRVLFRVAGIISVQENDVVSFFCILRGWCSPFHHFARNIQGMLIASHSLEERSVPKCCAWGSGHVMQLPSTLTYPFGWLVSASNHRHWHCYKENRHQKDRMYRQSGIYWKFLDLEVMSILNLQLTINNQKHFHCRCPVASSSFPGEAFAQAWKSHCGPGTQWESWPSCCNSELIEEVEIGGWVHG